MEALLYLGTLVGILLIFAGIFLLIKRVGGHQSEIEVVGLGSIKTTHHGVALSFLGVVLILQATTALIQRDELKRSLNELKRSNALIVSFLTPSLMADTAFQNYFKATIRSQQEAILARAIGMLRPEFRKVTDEKQAMFEEKDFGSVASIYKFLLGVDARDGSALYYKGEVQRLLRRRHTMRENFNLYLTYAPARGLVLPGISGLGYFDERTGWVNHLLANDILCEAFQTSDPAGQRELLQHLDDKVKQERIYWQKGFDAGETTLSTSTLERAAKDGLDKIPRPKCPSMT